MERLRRERAANFSIEEIEIPKNVSASITHISSIGEVAIEFNSTMRTEFNQSWINSTTIDMYIKPDKYRMQEDDFKTEDLNFTWEFVSF